MFLFLFLQLLHIYEQIRDASEASFISYKLYAIARISWTNGSLKQRRIGDVKLANAKEWIEMHTFATLNVHLSYFLGPIKKCNLSVQKWQKVT